MTDPTTITKVIQPSIETELRRPASLSIQPGDSTSGVPGRGPSGARAGSGGVCSRTSVMGVLTCLHPTIGREQSRLESTASHRWASNTAIVTALNPMWAKIDGPSRS